MSTEDFSFYLKGAQMSTEDFSFFLKGGGQYTYTYLCTRLARVPVQTEGPFDGTLGLRRNSRREKSREEHTHTHTHTNTHTHTHTDVPDLLEILCKPRAHTHIHTYRYT